MAPHTPVEERVAGIVAVLLGREQVSVDDDFFMLGGHSLLGTQLIARVAEAYGVDVSLRSLFEAPTVRQLSAEIERTTSEMVVKPLRAICCAVITVTGEGVSVSTRGNAEPVTVMVCSCLVFWP